MTAPSFWRTELWHPLLLHFPIVLLLMATAAKVLALVVKGEKQIYWQKVGAFLLITGVAFAWVTVYTGDLAEGIVARKICDPILLKQHENASYTMAWYFTSAIFVYLLCNLNFEHKLKAALRFLTLILMLVGSGYLIYASHLGVQVVYEQAGGVNVPPSDCSGM